MNKLNILPDSASYSVTDGKEVIATQLDGGAARYRRDILGATSRVTCQWTVGQDVYRYLRAFYRSATTNGATPFLIDLILDDPTLTEHKAYFIPGTMQLRETVGHKYVLYAELEVIPDLPDAAFDDALIFLYEEYGIETVDTIERLMQLVTVDLPGAF